MQQRYTGNVTCHLAMKSFRTYTSLKKYSSQRIYAEYLKINSKRDGLDTLIKYLKNWKRQIEACSSKPNMTTVDKLVRLLHQKGQKQINHLTHQTYTKTYLIQCSIIQIIHRVFVLKCLSLSNMVFAYYR